MKFTDAIYQPRFSVIDTHCHYNLEPLYLNWQEHWKKAQEHRVNFAIVPGTNLETSQRALDIAAQDERLFAMVGIHPTEVMTVPFELEQSIDRLERMMYAAKEAGKPVFGVGEIGLDYFRVKEDDAVQRSEQRVWFRRQLQLAKDHELPVSLHVRDQETPSEPTPDNAYWDVVQILKDFEEDGWIPDQMTMHCVSGPVEYVQELLDMGAFAGFDGNLTYPNAAQIRKIWRMVPPNKRLLETDAPYLPPQQHRGKTCEPWMISLTAEYADSELTA